MTNYGSGCRKDAVNWRLEFWVSHCPAAKSAAGCLHFSAGCPVACERLLTTLAGWLPALIVQFPVTMVYVAQNTQGHRTHAHTHTHTHARTRTRTRAHTHTHTHTHTRTHARAHARTHTHTHTRTHSRTHARTHTNTHAHALTHARTHAQSFSGIGLGWSGLSLSGSGLIPNRHGSHRYLPSGHYLG